MHYGNSLSSFLIHYFHFFWVLGETRPRLHSRKEVPLCGALGPSLVLLAQHFYFAFALSKPMLIIVCILGFMFMFYVRSHACLTDCWSSLPAARLPMLTSYRF